MGSYDYRCAISGLPIERGDRVRMLLLTQGPHYRGRSSAKVSWMSGDYWFPRTVPLSGTYVGSGRFEPDQEGFATQSILDLLSIDIVEKGPGVDPVRDVAVRKESLTWARLWDALLEGRVQVRPNVDRWAVHRLVRDTVDTSDVDKRQIHQLIAETRGFLDDLYAPKEDSRRVVPVGIPTRRRVEAVLRKNGFTIHDPKGDTSYGYMVNRLDPFTVRVRSYAVSDKDDSLEAIRSVLERKWATVLTLGLGAYFSEAELQVKPKPEAFRAYDSQTDLYCIHRRNPVRPLCVTPIMVREDVWLRLLADPVCLSSDTEVTFGDMALKVRAELEKHRQHEMFSVFAGAASISDPYLTATLWDGPSHEAMGLAAAWSYFILMAGREKIPPQEEFCYVHAVAEMLFLRLKLERLSFRWMPSFGLGTQLADWSMHAKFASIISAVALRKEAGKGPPLPHRKDM